MSITTNLGITLLEESQSGKATTVNAALSALDATYLKPVQVLTADPTTPVAGQMWFRSDTLQLCYYDGTAVKRSAAFT